MTEGGGAGKAHRLQIGTIQEHIVSQRNHTWHGNGLKGGTLVECQISDGSAVGAEGHRLERMVVLEGIGRYGSRLRSAWPSGTRAWSP